MSYTVSKSRNGTLHKTRHGRAICNRNLYTADTRLTLEDAAARPNACEKCFG